MTTSLKDMLINSMLVTLVVVCVLTGSVIIGTNYGLPSTTMTTNQLNLSKLTNDLNNTNSQAFIWENSFHSSIPFFGIGIAIITTLWNIGGLIADTIMGTFNMFFTILINIFGTPLIVIGVLTTIVIITLIIAVNRFWTNRD